MDSQKKHLSNRVFVYAVIWAISYAGSLLALKSFSLPKEAGVALTVVTILAFAIFIYKYYKSIFVMDEVEIKIQMEAVIIAFSWGLLLLMTLGFLNLL
jgi:hypothetical protein